MKTFKIYLLAMTLLVSALCFAACGNTNNDDNAATTENVTTENGANSGIINDTTNNGNADGTVTNMGEKYGKKGKHQN